MEERLLQVKSALISVYYKDQLKPLVETLHQQGATIYSTGGTQQFISEQNIPVTAVESITNFPEILGGRVKTLHPAVFGGILNRRDNSSDQEQMKAHQLPSIDLVVVDLYPFEETLASGASHQDIIEKIDIGGISLIRAAAKNFHDVAIISSKEDYVMVTEWLKAQQGKLSLAQRKQLAAKAFHISSHYDTLIHKYLDGGEENYFKSSVSYKNQLRYGENPHQQGFYYGDLNQDFEKLNGKELSYNNLIDVEAAVYLIDEFKEITFAILKHNNACGIASSSTSLLRAWNKALAADPVSAFGGILISNTKIDLETAQEINKLFFEVIIAPEFDEFALQTLKEKKNRIILKRKSFKFPDKQFKTLLNGVLVQDRDTSMEAKTDMKVVTTLTPSQQELKDLEFALKVVKHTKSNTIVLAKNNQLLASGIGQTSRVDALHQAIAKAHHFGFDLKGAVMASDAFFPFPDCVEIAGKVGVTAVVQPGGSVKDQDSVDYCNKHNISMLFTGVRHFKH
jgi:phosphoribosylaminoimidazolecarboxamide formyltransferase / IMP cyclohydrolase